MTASSKHLQKLLRALALAVLFSVGLSAAPRSAHAQVVVCANCSEAVTQWAEYAEQLLQYAKQVQQYELQIKQWENMVKNTKTIKSVVFDNALSHIRGVESIMNNASNIRYMMGNLDGNFKNLYPDVYQHISQIKGISSAQALLNDFNRGKQVYDTALTALKAAQSQSADLSADQYRMDSAAGSLISADGHLDALQAAGEYAQMSAQQLMKLRQLALVQIQTQSAIAANVAREKDLRTAAVQNWIEDKPATPRATPHGSAGF